jgi:hypothetical protein
MRVNFAVKLTLICYITLERFFIIPSFEAYLAKLVLR